VSASNEGSRAVRVLDDATVETLARHWEDGWNRGDLETIMAPFASDVVFSSPGISMMTGDPAKTTIEGADALRAYVDAALRRTRGIRYTLQATFAGVDSVVLVYTCGLPDGAQTPGADLMRVDSDGNVVEWRCHY
jgi:ketosteroid isomerase-like protein